MKTTSSIILLLLLHLSSYGQVSDNITNIAEGLAADESDPESLPLFIDQLHELSEDPVKINSTDINEISRLFFLSDFQVKALADYVKTTGAIVSVFEIANIPGFDPALATQMQPFITLETKPATKNSLRWKNSLMLNYSYNKSGSDTSSVGPPYKLLSKYKFTAGRLTGGFTLEKDPGEKLLNGKPPLPDFLSANLAYSSPGLVKKVIIGDYSVRIGMGAGINTSFRRGLSLTSPGYMSANNEIKPYTSSDENRFLRGIASEFSLKNFDLLMFYSRNRIDATQGSSDGISKDYIESFYTSGLHNTYTLLNKKDNINITAYGVAITYNSSNFKAGTACSGNRFSLPVIPDPDDAGKLFSFKGKRRELYSFYYTLFIKKILLYGEATMTEALKSAIVQGVSFRPSDRLSVNAVFRSYDRSFSSFYGSAPGAGSVTSNEKGLLGNFTFEAAKHVFISAGCDVRIFPWLKYLNNSPSRGVRKEIKIKYTPSEKAGLDLIYSYNQSTSDDDSGTGIPMQNRIISRSIKISGYYSVDDALYLGARADCKIVNTQGSRGFALLQDVKYTFRTLPLSLWFRYSIYNTANWDSRIYIYENDLLYSFSIPAFSGEGSRSYLMAKWDITDFADLRIKYACSDKVTGNSNEIKLQFRVSF